MTLHSSRAASAAFVTPGVAEVSFKDKLKDKVLLRKVAYDLALWFLAGLFITEMLGRYAPGYPIIVGTPSLPTGLYWVDRAASPNRNDIVTFPFNPAQKWISERYTPGYLVSHTKILKGVPGDVVFADAEQHLTLCPHEKDLVGPPRCESIGAVRDVDSKGRKMHGWLSPNTQYVIRPGEYWVYAPHPMSLDSRYHGPILANTVPGRVSPVWLFKIGS